MKRLGSSYERLRTGLLDLIWPKFCLDCGREGDYWCPSCRGKLKLRQSKECPICRQDNQNGAVCDRCKDQSYLDGLWVMADYDDPVVEKVIQALKYHLVRELSRSFDEIFTRYFFPSFHWDETAELVPIPLHPRRRLTRGFNQAELIAQSLSRVRGNRVVTDILCRRRLRPPQAQLTYQERLTNMRDSFTVRSRRENANHLIILVDDVYTTGATMQECARTLKEAGFPRVWGLTLARGNRA